MKKIILLVIVAVASLTLSSYAGPKKQLKKDLKITLSPSKINLVERNGQVDVMFKMSVPANYVHSKHQYMFTPVLTDYNNIMPLETIIINGQKYAKMSAKNGHHKDMKQKLDAAPDMSKAIQLNASKNARMIDYEYTIPFEPWMANAHLVCIQRFNSKKNTTLIAEEIYGHGVEVTTIPTVIETVAIVDNIEGIININFPISSSKINMNLGDNRNEIAEMENIIMKIMNNKANIVDSIIITASSSPDGRYASNEKLAMARAKSVKSYLLNKFDFKSKYKDVVKTKCVAENWVGLAALVLASDVPNKARILKAISIRNLAQRERAMMALPEYPYIKKYILPSLRFVKYEIFYHTVTIAIIEVEAAPAAPKMNTTLTNQCPACQQKNIVCTHNKLLFKEKVNHNRIVEKAKVKGDPHYYRYHRDEWKNMMIK